jgi:8-oxo-dGTP diphosphatase
MPAPVLGVAVMVSQGTRVLLVRRARPPFAGAWAFPGGKVRFAESLTAAAVREVMEETGIAIRELERISVVEIIDPAPDGSPRSHNVVVVFAAIADPAAPVAADDAADARWVPLADADGLGLTRDTARILSAGAAVKQS